MKQKALLRLISFLVRLCAPLTAIQHVRLVSDIAQKSPGVSSALYIESLIKQGSFDDKDEDRILSAMYKKSGKIVLFQTKQNMGRVQLAGGKRAVLHPERPEPTLHAAVLHALPAQGDA